MSVLLMDKFGNGVDRFLRIVINRRGVIAALAVALVTTLPFVFFRSCKRA